jgi:hypothetical protein
MSRSRAGGRRARVEHGGVTRRMRLRMIAIVSSSVASARADLTALARRRRRPCRRARQDDQELGADDEN